MYYSQAHMEKHLWKFDILDLEVLKHILKFLNIPTTEKWDSLPFSLILDQL